MINLSSWQDIMDAAFATIGDSEAKQTWVTTDQLESWANQCLWEIAEHSEPVDKVIEWSATIGSAEYEINSTGHGTLGLSRVEIDGEAILPTTTDRLQESNQEWRTVTGEPQLYYRDGLAGISDDGLVFGLHPVPDAENDVRAIITVVPDAVDNDSMTDRIMLPLWAVPGLLWGILAIAYSAETRLQNLKTARVFRLLYDDMLGRLKGRSYSRLNRDSVYGYGPITKPRPGYLSLWPTDGITEP